MRENKSAREHGAILATIDQKLDWIRTPARELDIRSEMDIAWALCKIMLYFQSTYDFAGVSSNNIYWETTDAPVKMICVPEDETFVTLINPKYEMLNGRSVNSIERCGSIPERSYVVRRKTHVVVSGYDMDGGHVELEYGSKRGKGPHCDSWVIQHEWII